MKYLFKKIGARLAVVAALATLCAAQASPLLEGADPRNIILILRVLRSPEFSAAAPAFLPLLASKNENVVRDTCRTLAAMGNQSVLPALEPLANDKRTKVRKDAQDAIARLQGQPIPGQPEAKAYVPPTFASYQPKDTVALLKLLRSPEYAAVVPAILPLLKSESANVIRDSCRTLAVIAGKEVIPNIQPLLNDKRGNVRKDAQDAIAQLSARP